MTLKMYADRGRIGPRGSGCRMKIHAKDCEDCETHNGKVDVITRSLSIEGDMDEATRARMVEIADMCPVHRTLENEVKIRTTLAAD